MEKGIVYCKSCGVVVYFDVVYKKAGWSHNLCEGIRVIKCPVCTELINDDQVVNQDLKNQ